MQNNHRLPIQGFSCYSGSPDSRRMAIGLIGEVEKKKCHSDKKDLLCGYVAPRKNRIKSKHSFSRGCSVAATETLPAKTHERIQRWNDGYKADELT